MKEQTSATNNTATETVLTLGSMSKRVVADLTNQRSIPHELASIISHHPSLMICPIIMEGETPYGMFSDFQSYPWVQPIIQYKADNVAELVSHLVNLL